MTDGLDRNMARLAEIADEIVRLEAELDLTPEKTPQYEAVSSRLNILYQQRSKLEGDGQSDSAALAPSTVSPSFA
jgi:hypothetical protein